MFVLYNLSQFVWIGSLLAMGYVKYPTRWMVSFSWAVLALVVMMWCWQTVKRAWAPLYYKVARDKLSMPLLDPNESL